MIRVTKNLALISDLLALAAIEAKREPRDVQLLAVSKKQPLQKILAARDAGQRDFGENFVQEGLDKIDQTRDKDLIWHFIGHLQADIQCAKLVRSLRTLTGFTPLTVQKRRSA